MIISRFYATRIIQPQAVIDHSKKRGTLVLLGRDDLQADVYVIGDEVEVCLVWFEELLRLDELVSRMQEVMIRPSSNLHLASFFLQYPEVCRGKKIVSLGTDMSNPRSALYVSWEARSATH